MSLFSDALDRLKKYNLGPFSLSSNPFGLTGAGGPDTNLEPMLGDVVTAAQAAADAVGTIAAAQSTVSMAWDSGTTVADPGAGRLRATTASPAAGSYSLLVSATDADGAGIGAMLSELGASSSATKAQARLVKIGDPSKYLDMQVTGVSGAGAYRTVAVTYLAGPGGFVAGDAVVMGWVRSGDKGDTGGASLPAGSAAAPGLAVTGDSDTGIAQAGGANTLSLVGFGAEVLRAIGVSGGTNLLSVTASNGGAPVLAAIGTSPNIDIQWSTKGGGGHYFAANGANQVLIGGPIDAGRMVYLAGSNGGNPTVSTTAGALNLTSATGVVLVNGSPITAAFPSAGQKTGAYTVTTADAGKLIPCTGSWTLSLLPAATAGNGFAIAIKNTGTGNITLTTSGSETIDGLPGAVLAAGQSVFLISDGTQWLSFAGGAGFTSTGAWSPTAKSIDATLSNNNLTITFVAPNQWRSARASSAVPIGKYYWEVRCNSGGSDAAVGIVDSTFTSFETSAFLSGLGAYRSTGDRQNSGGAAAYGATWTAGDVIGVALDTAAGRMWFRKNGVWQASGDPVAGANAAFTGLTGTIYPAVGTATNAAFTGRFRQPDWGYAAPSGFSPLP